MQNPSLSDDFPTKRYFTISEVSELCEVKAHVLRYWEQEFSVLAPQKRRGRRYYTYDDIILVRKIRRLLYDEGFSIVGARKQLTQKPEQKTRASLGGVIQNLESIIREIDVAIESSKEK